MAILLLVDSQLVLWRDSLGKCLTLLSSLANLVEQFETVQRADSLGVLSQHGEEVCPLLQVKLLACLERTLKRLKTEK